MKGIPTSYNKDLQEDKEALFDSFDTINYLIRIATGVMETLTINKARMEAALSVDLLATYEEKSLIIFSKRLYN